MLTGCTEVMVDGITKNPMVISNITSIYKIDTEKK